MPHSPAPWTLSPDGEITAADDTVIIYTENGYFRPKEEDALLVTAAPDLLSTLQRVEKELTAGLNPQFNRLPWEQGFALIEALRTSITKATKK